MSRCILKISLRKLDPDSYSIAFRQCLKSFDRNSIVLFLPFDTGIHTWIPVFSGHHTDVFFVKFFRHYQSDLAALNGSAPVKRKYIVIEGVKFILCIFIQSNTIRQIVFLFAFYCFIPAAYLYDLIASFSEDFERIVRNRHITDLHRRISLMHLAAVSRIINSA